MIYTLIGTGNMAWFLATRFQDAGFICSGVYGRNSAAAAELATFLQTDSYSLSAAKAYGDCCVLAVSDYAVAAIAKTLRLPPDTTVIHTAGSLSLDSLPQLHKAVLWPVYSIRKNNLPAKGTLIPIAVEAATAKAAEIVSQLAYAISEEVAKVNSMQRAWLHLAAVIGNNFTTHLMTICHAICEAQQLPDTMIHPILQQTLEQILSGMYPGKLQTGPAQRRDMATLDRHFALLQANPQWQTLYAAISASILAVEKSVDSNHAGC